MNNLTKTALICLALTTPDIAAADPIKVSHEPIDYFNIGSSDQSAGKLTYIGGLEIESEDKSFGGFSGLRISSDGKRLYSVSDTSLWLTAEIKRDEKDKIIALSKTNLSCLCRANGSPYGSKHWGDAEGLEIAGKSAYVVFERLNRINIYPIKSDLTPGKPKQATASFKPFKVSYSEGLEALALAPKASPLAGKFIAIAEESLNAKGQNRAFIADAKTITEFAITRDSDYSVTDATFLPDGDLLILERRVGLSVGVGTRIRRIKSAAIKKGAELTGETLMEASLSSRIDNMEGITTWQTSTGETRIAIMSDDNFNVIQRTLLLEFRLND